jgi:hypothetical protein
MATAERRPSKAGYWIGGVIALLGIAAGVALLVATFAGGAREVKRFDRLPRVSVPGQAELSLSAAKYVVYLESTQGEPPTGGVEVTVEDAATGRPVVLEPYATSFTYTAGRRSGRAVHTFIAERSGRYRVGTLGSPASGLSVAVGPPLGGKLAGAVSSAFAGFGLLFGGPIVGGAIMLITSIRRQRFDQRTAPAARPASPPGWYADPSGQSSWRWWDGQRWTEHTG